MQQHSNVPPGATSSICLFPLSGIPEVNDGDDVHGLVVAALNHTNASLQDDDIIVVSQKIISKAEGRRVLLKDVVPSERALELAAKTDKDPRLVEVVLSESRDVLRARPGLIIVEHRLGLVMANAGIDQSNLGDVDDESVLLLPVDPDASAVQLQQALTQSSGRRLAVVIIDSVGRAWRQGVVGLAIGVAGLQAHVDLRGQQDRNGRELGVTTVGLADQIASAASLLMGEAAQGQPVVVVRGLEWPSASVSDNFLGASELLRPPESDLFR